MFEVNNGITNINGKQGKYDDKVTNPSVKYGRNAVENNFTYMEQPIIADNLATPPILDFGLSPDAPEKNAEKLEKYLNQNNEYLEALPPLEFEYRYMPNMHKKGKIDKQAVLGAAYEEMGGSKELSINDLDNRFAPNENFTSASLDINKDGKVDIAEYSSSILAADMLSKSDIPNTDNIDGTINAKGFNAILEYSQKSKAAAAAALYSNIYNTYGLNQALKEFKPE